MVSPDREFWRGKRVLVTGHTGFKGVWLTLWLAELGAEPLGLSLPPEAAPSLAEQVRIEARVPGPQCDIRDAGATGAAIRELEPDIVLHLAAQALVRRSYLEPRLTFETNVVGTVNILDAISATPSVRAAVIVTTDKCYANAEWVWPYREIDPLGGHDPYSASKACAELVAASWRDSFPSGRSVSIATARAGNVIGGGDWAADRLIPDCMRAFARREPVMIRNPHAVRPWQHVLEPLCGYLLLAEQLWEDGDEFSEAWNFGPSPDEARPVSWVLDCLTALWGDGAAWQTEPGDHPHEADRLMIDASKARAHLGWKPRLPLYEALARTADWYRREAQGEDPAELILGEIKRYEARGASS